MELFKKIGNQQDIIIQIQNNFNIENVVVGSLTFGSVIPVVLVQFKELKDVEKHWKEFNSLITAEYLIKLEKEFSKWNSYVFYVVTGEISKSLKYEIENNKFSTRKIVIEMEEVILDQESIKNIISEHIVNDNIKYDILKKDIGEFLKNELISGSFNNLINGTEKKVEDSTLIEILTKIEAELE